MRWPYRSLLALWSLHYKLMPLTPRLSPLVLPTPCAQEISPTPFITQKTFQAFHR